MGPERIVDLAWFARHPVEVAWDLIGCVLCVTRNGDNLAGRIVETEAYAGPADPASHASRLQRARGVMAGSPGTVYVYRSYGIHTIMNVVAHLPGASGAVLLRGLEPIHGIEAMRARRSGVDDGNIASGPGRIGQALGIRLEDTGIDVRTSQQFALVQGEANAPILSSPRIGISRAKAVRWRFFEAANCHVSRDRRGDVVDRADVYCLIPPPGTEIT